MNPLQWQVQDEVVHEKLDWGGWIIDENHEILDNPYAQMVQDLLEYRNSHN